MKTYKKRRSFICVFKNNYGNITKVKYRALDWDDVFAFAMWYCSYHSEFTIVTELVEIKLRAYEN